METLQQTRRTNFRGLLCELATEEFRGLDAQATFVTTRVGALKGMLEHDAIPAPFARTSGEQPTGVRQGRLRGDQRPRFSRLGGLFGMHLTHPAARFEQNMLHPLGKQRSNPTTVKHGLKFECGNRIAEELDLGFAGHQAVLFQEADDRAEVGVASSLEGHNEDTVGG